MRHYRSLFLVFLIVTTLFVFSSCDGEKASVTTYTVQVPQFAEGNGSDAKVGIPITGEDISNPSTVKRFFAYRISPPITGFKEQKIEKGSKINTKMFGHDITLSMTVAENGNYIFEGANDSEYIKVEISKDNKTFNYVHALILDVNAGPGTNDEFDVVEGAGEILSNNHFDSYGTAYYLGDGGDAVQYKFLLHGKNDGKMAWFCYDGVKKESTDSVSFTKASDYKTNCIDVVKERISGDSKYYVAVFDKNGLIFDSVLETPAATDEANLYDICMSNGLGDFNLTSAEQCIGRINTLGFSSWDVNNSATKWNININHSPTTL